MMTKKEIRLQEEKKLKEKMSEKSYAQHSLKKALEFKNSVNFSFYFLMIVFSIVFVVFLVSLLLSYSTFEMVITIILGVCVVLILIAFLVWKLTFEKRYNSKILNNREILARINKQEAEKLLKISEKLKKTEN